MALWKIVAPVLTVTAFMVTAQSASAQVMFVPRPVPVVPVWQPAPVMVPVWQPAPVMVGPAWGVSPRPVYRAGWYGGRGWNGGRGVVAYRGPRGGAVAWRR
jgi:hypothetical protein